MAQPGGPTVFVFAPSPLLTVTIESGPGEGNDAEVHLHAGGQGFLIARMLVRLGARAHLCAPLSGESGDVLAALMEREGVRVRRSATTRVNGAYVHDRRGGERRTVAQMPPSPLSRHEIDELYSSSLAEGAAADVCVLAGPAVPHLLPADTYRRLAADLRALGATVVADLAGKALTAALAGGVTLLKVSHEELVEDGRSASADPEHLAAAMRSLVADGAGTVVVSRAGDPAMALADGRCLEVAVPALEVVDHRGAGDAMTAGLAAALGAGAPVDAALRLGAAAGALNVTRRGLATGHRDVVERLAERVLLRPVEALRRS